MKDRLVREGLAFSFLEISGNHLYAGTWWKDWHVVDATNPADLQYVTSRPPREVWTMIVRESVAFVADGTQVNYYDLADPAAPELIVQTDSTAYHENRGLFSLELVDGRLVGSKVGGEIFQITTVGRFRMIGYGGRYMAANGPYLYSTQNRKLYVWTRQNDYWVVLNQVPVTGLGDPLRVSGNRLYLAGDDLQVFDITDPVSPMFMGQVALGGISAVEVEGDIVYVTPRGDARELVAYDCSDGTAPRKVGSIETVGEPEDISLFGEYVFLAEGTNGIVTYQRQINIVQPLEITAWPTNQVVDIADGFSLTVTATGSNSINYQWFKDGVAILGATNANYSAAPGEATRMLAGSYFVQVSDGIETINSAPVDVRILGGLALEFRERAGALGGYELVLSAAGGIGYAEGELEHSTNLLDWTGIEVLFTAGPETETIILDSADLPGSGPHFLRIVEE